MESDFTKPYPVSFVDQWRARIGDAERIHVSVIPFHTFAGSIRDGRFVQLPSRGFYVYVPCYRVTYELLVQSDGVATLCCLDSERTLAVGNVHQATLRELGNGPDARRLRDAMRQDRYWELPLCAACLHSEKFVANCGGLGGFRRVWVCAGLHVRRWWRNRLFA